MTLLFISFNLIFKHSSLILKHPSICNTKQCYIISRSITLLFTCLQICHKCVLLSFAISKLPNYQSISRSQASNISEASASTTEPKMNYVLAPMLSPRLISYQQNLDDSFSHTVTWITNIHSHCTYVDWILSTKCDKFIINLIKKLLKQ